MVAAPYHDPAYHTQCDWYEPSFPDRYVVDLVDELRRRV